MMKQVNIRIPLRVLGLLLGLFLSVGAFAQIEVKGHVKDAQGEPVIGATVRCFYIIFKFLNLQNILYKNY